MEIKHVHGASFSWRWTEKTKINTKKSSPSGHSESPILREVLLLKIPADREVVCILIVLPVPVFLF